MSHPLDTVEQELTRHAIELNAWLSDAYEGIEDRQFQGEMDAGYPNWADIESLAGHIFDQRLVHQLNPASIDRLLFFVSRSDELSSIIAWLSPFTGKPFSWCGNLVYSDFLFLAKQALLRDDDYCDYQLAACFRKLESLDDEAIEVLLGFFNKKDSYTRRMALHAFEDFGHPQTIDLATTLWRTDDCEFAKLSCLHALKRFPEAKPLFDIYFQEYQSLYDVNAEEYRLSHMRELTGDGSRQS